MRRALMLALLCALVAAAQPQSSIARHIGWGAALPATCSPNTGDVFFKTGAPIGLYYCSAPDTWTVAGAGAGTANYSQSFVGQVSVTLAHGLGTPNLVVQCYDNASPKQAIEYNTLTVAAAAPYAATVTFSGAQTGSCTVNGTGGGGGGGGNLVSTNNLSDVADAPTALGNLAGVAGRAALTTAAKCVRVSAAGTLEEVTGCEIDASGFMSQGIGVTTGVADSLGAAGRTTASNFTIWDGDADNEPAWMRFVTNSGNDAYLYACGESDGHLCVAAATPAAKSVNFVQTALNNYCENATGTDSYSCAISPAPTANHLVAGMRFRFKADVVNTGAASFDPDAGGAIAAIAIKKAVGGVTTDLASNDIRAGQVVDLVYDGTNCQMQSTLGNATGGGTYYQTVDDEDTPLTQRVTINFEGAGVTCADDTDQTTCTIPGAGAGGGTVTHVSGALTADQPVLGNGSDDIKTASAADAALALFGPKTYVSLQEEFLAGSATTTLQIGTHGWAFAGGTASRIDAEANHPGILELNTSAASGTVSYVALTNNASTTQTFIVNSTVFRAVWIARVNSTTQFKVRLGFAQDPTTDGPSTHAVYFENISAGAQANWYCTVQTGTGADQTTVDSTIVADTNFHSFEIRNDGSNNYTFLIDGTARCGTIATDVPTNPITPYFQIVNSETVAKTLDMDAVHIFQKVSR